MKRRNNLRKRVFALVLGTILCVASSSTAFASTITTKDNSDVVSYTSIEPRALGNCVASDGVIASGYGCKLVLHLDRSYFNLYVRAAATGNANNGVVCSVTFPDGSTYPLGTITANGSKTSYLLYSGTAPAGNYTFNFTGTDAGTTGFLGYIYSSY